MEMPKLLTVKETAEILRVSVDSIQRLTLSGDLKRVKVGKRVLIRESDLVNFIEAQTS